MDRITKALLNEFIIQNGILNQNESTAFEYFTGYLVTSKHYTENFNPDDIAVGAGGDCGIDCISIIVNGNLITEPDEIADLEQTNGYLDVTLIFTQAERSSSFESEKIGQFAFGVRDFLGESPTLVQNDSIKKKSKILTEIFDRSSKFKNGNPRCFLYYVTTGKWVNDQNLVARLTAERSLVFDLGLFREVGYYCTGAEEVQNLYRSTKNAISREVIFLQRTVLPELEGIEQSYIGYLPGTEYLKLIETDTGEIVTSIFYDNVRHWQEWNKVNKEIKETLESDITRNYFPLLNNGVTIIAKSIKPTANRFLLEDYQIVNGCQTSFVLHESRSYVDENVQIPIRLISTTNEDIRNSIIKATNRQTEVTEEQLFALSDFPKKLENYFPTFEGVKKLFYERRSRQYNADENVEKVRVINMNTLVKSYSSIFLKFPHRTSRNYKALLSLIGSDIFDKDHRLEMYYICSFIQYRLEFLFRNQFFERKYKNTRYHIQMVYWMLATQNSAMPRKNSHDMRRLCEKVMEITWNDDHSKGIFSDAVAIIEEAAGEDYHNDNIRTESYTSAVLILTRERIQNIIDSM